MKKKPTFLLLLVAIWATGLVWSPLRADEPAATPPPADAAASTPVVPAAAPAEPTAPPPAVEAPAEPAAAKNAPEPRKFVERGEVVGAGSVIAASERASKAVAIIGDLTVDGEVRHDAVVIRGSLLVNGRVGHDAVVILGDSVINGHVDGAVVCVLGTLELGPKAEVGRDCVVVGGVLSNPHHAPIHGQTVVVGADSPRFDGALSWFKRGLLEGRLLVPDIGWPWLIFGGFLLFYLLLAALFGRGISACAQTLEESPGKTLVASLVLIPLVPLLSVALGVITIGIGFPFIGVALTFAKLFGKAAFLAFLGRAILRAFGAEKAVLSAPLAVLIGAGMMAVLYMVPVLGLLVYGLTGWIGFGMVVYTVILKRRKEKAVRAAERAADRAAAASRAAAVPPVRKFGTPPPAPTSTPTESGAAPAVEATPRENPVPNLPQMSAGFAGERSGAAESGVNIPVAPLPPPPPVAPIAPASSWNATPSQISATTCPRADFGVRFAALIIDLVLVGAGAGILGFAHFIPVPAWVGAYMFGMWLWRGTTVGGVILNLRIVRLDGRPIDPATAVVRTLVGYLSVAAAGIGFLWCLWDDEQQTWHDKVAGTVVVRAPKGTSLV